MADLESVTQATVARGKAARRAVDIQWEREIREASKAGFSYRQIAVAANVSFQRVAQIVSEAKEEK